MLHLCGVSQRLMITVYYGRLPGSPQIMEFPHIWFRKTTFLLPCQLRQRGRVESVDLVRCQVSVTV